MNIVSDAYLVTQKYQFEKHVVRVLIYRHPCGNLYQILKQGMLKRAWAFERSKQHENWRCDLAVYADRVDGENDWNPCWKNYVSILDSSENGIQTYISFPP